MIKIYTDGSCQGNPGPGGSAFIIIKENKIVNQRQFPFKLATNNYCELFAVTESIRYVLDNNIVECEIYSDSKYVVDGINEWMNNWVRNDWRTVAGHQIQNIDIWKSINILWEISKSLCNISIHYVKGHSSDEWNKIVDKLARDATKMN